MSREVTQQDIELAQEKMLRAKHQRIFNAQSEGQRIALARKSANRYKDCATHKILGQHIGSVPMNEFYMLRKKYGNECFNEQDFLKYLNNKVLRPNGMAHNKL
jgi:hypothetical protein